MKYSNLLLAALTATALTFTACGGGGTTTTPVEKTDAEKKAEAIAAARAAAFVTPASTTLSGDIASNTKLTADQTWLLDGLVVVKDYATLEIEAGTKIVAAAGDGDNTSYLIVDKDSKIMAEGTAAAPITFTSEDETAGAGKWGGVTIIGNAGNSQVKAYEANTDFEASDSNLADDSGVLSYVTILNSGITMETDKEINGLSLVGVGSGTTIEHITVTDSDDDCIEAWGGTVNMTDLTLSGCTDDFFDIDDGYSGIVDGLKISSNGTGNAGIEQSGTTAATFKNFEINVTANNKEGGIYFKKSGIGGHFENGTVTMAAGTVGGAIFSEADADIANTSFKNVTLTSADMQYFVDKTDAATDSADELKEKFEADATNVQN